MTNDEWDMSSGITASDDDFDIRDIAEFFSHYGC